MRDSINLPFDFALANENKIRLTSLGVFILSIVYLFTGNWVLPLFLILDFFLRAFKFSNYSVLNIISDNFINLLNIPAKPVELAPKRFAAKIGFILFLNILITDLFDLTTVATVLAAILALFALLESLFGFCAGCYIYNIYLKLFKKKALIN